MNEKPVITRPLEIDDNSTDLAKNYSIKNGVIKFDGLPEPTNKVYGFEAGAKSGVENAIDLVLPNLFDYQQAGDWRASLASGVTNPVNIATAFIPSGVVASAGYSAVADTLSDYLVRKQQDANAEYSVADLASEFAGGAVGGALLHGLVKGLFPAIKATKSILTQDTQTNVENIINSIIKPENVVDDVDRLHLSDQAINANNDLKSNALPLDETNKISLNNSIPLDDLKKWSEELIQPLDDLGLSDEAKKYTELIPKDKLDKRLPDIRTADKLISTYGGAEDIGSALQNIEQRNKIRLGEYTKLDDETNKFLSDPTNKPELFNALYGKSTDPIAIKSAQVYKDLGQNITDSIRPYVDVGYLDNRFGRQQWDTEILQKIGYKQWAKDLNSAGYYIKSSNGDILPITEENAKYIYDNIIHEQTKGVSIVSGANKKSRVLLTDNPAGAYAIEKVYGGDRNMLKVLDDDIRSGSKDIAKYSLFGKDIGGVTDEIENISKYKFGKNSQNIDTLREVINPRSTTSKTGSQRIVNAVNNIFVGAKAVRAVTSPLYQTQFMPADLFGAVASSIGKYGSDLFKGLARGNFSELKTFSKYAKLPDNELQGLTSYLRSGIDQGDGKWLNGVAKVTAKFDGSHFADTPVRKLATFLNALGERELMRNGKSTFNIEPKILDEAIGDGVLPDSEKLLNIAKDKIKPIDGLKAEQSKLFDDYNTNEESFKTSVEKLVEDDKSGRVVYAKDVRDGLSALNKINNQIVEHKKNIAVLKANNPNIDEQLDINSEIKLYKNHANTLQIQLNKINKGILKVEKELSTAKAKNQSTDLIKESLAQGKIARQQTLSEISRNDSRIKDLSSLKTFDQVKYDNAVEELTRARNEKDLITEQLKQSNSAYKSKKDLNNFIDFLKSDKYQKNADILDKVDATNKQIDDIKLEHQKYIDAANEIDAKMQSATNDANPLQYQHIFKIEKGSPLDILPFRMARWVLNSWLNINVKMAKNLGTGLLNRQYGKALSNASGLALYGLGIGLTETAINYMRDSNSFNSENTFVDQLVKNSAYGVALGNLYLPTLVTSAIIKHTAKAGYQYWIDNPEKAQEELKKSSAWYPMINAMSDH